MSDSAPLDLQCLTTDPGSILGKSSNPINCQLLHGHGGMRENFDQGVRFRWFTVPKLTEKDALGPQKINSVKLVEHAHKLKIESARQEK